MSIFNRLKAMARSLIVVGSGGHALSLTSLAMDLDYEITAYFSETSQLKSIYGVTVTRDYSWLLEQSSVEIAVAIGDNYVRERVVYQIRQKAAVMNVEIRFPKLIHPTVSLGRMASVGEGTVVFPGSNVGAHSVVDSFCILNHHTSIDHESNLKEFTSCAPGVVMGGKVTINERSAILIGASLAHQVTVGTDTVLAGNSFLNTDAEPLKLYGGTPARILRNRSKGDPYL